MALGRILRPHGIRGEVRTMLLTDFPERFEETEEVFLVSPEGQVTAGRVEGARFHQGRVLLKLAGVDTPEAGAALRHWLVAVEEADLVPLEDDEYWHFQLEGLEVHDEEGRRLGRLREVLPTPGHDLYAVDGPEGEVLIPAVAEFVKRVDLEAGIMVVRPPVLEGPEPA